MLIMGVVSINHKVQQDLQLPLQEQAPVALQEDSEHSRDQVRDLGEKLVILTNNNLKI